ncbi:MAG: glycosyltransferase [Dissulfurispiraceae bacterium]
MERTVVSNPFAGTLSKPLTGIHVAGLALLLTLVILFGALVEFRGAFAHKRMTDIGTYLRAAWAVRAGGDIYAITDDHGRHYVYPPLFAILMTPLADPPQGIDRNGYLPYEVSVGLWYVLTLIIGVVGVGTLSKVIEYPPRNLLAGMGTRFSRQWWALRVIPLVVLLPAIGRSQMRGQVGLLVAFLLCYMVASILKGERFRAGLWLSGAICIKFIPVLLLVFPLWRRDWRMLSGSLLGLVMGLIIVPAVTLGPQRAVDSYGSFYHGILVTGVKGDIGGQVGGELTCITSTDSNSPMVVLHNIIYPERKHRPKVAHAGERMAHWVTAFVMMAITLIASGWKGRWYTGKVDATVKDAAFMAAFIPLMLVTSPVFHPHYVSMTIPLVILLVVIIWEHYPYGNIPAAWKAVFCFIAISHLLTSIDRGIFVYLRDFGLVLLSTITLWAASLAALRQTSARPSIAAIPETRPFHVEINKVAVILPAFNEKMRIRQTVESAIEFSNRNPKYHFVFVDDGSRDGTAEILQETFLKRPNAGNVSFSMCEENKGKGNAIRTGFHMIDADAYCFTDADLAYSLDYLKLIEEKLKTSDVIIASRSLLTRLSRESVTTRLFLSTLFNHLTRLILGLPFRDTQAGLKGFRRDAVKLILPKSKISRFSFDAELLFLARKYGLRVDEFHVSEHKEHSYKKGKKLFIMSLSMFRELILIMWRNLIGRYN